MIISKDSWHYKLLTEDLFWKDGYAPSNSLCIYFWQVFGRLLQGIGTVMVVVSPIVAYCLFYLNFAPDDIGVFIIPLCLWAIVGLAVTGFGILSIIVLILFCFSEVGKWISSKNPYKKEESEDPKPSLVYSYLKAKKEKICPIITFKGDNH